MILNLLLLSLAFADESSNESRSPLLYSGLDLDAAMFRTTTSAKINSDTLDPVTIVDLMGKQEVQVQHYSNEQWQRITVEFCQAAKTANAHIRSLTQTADNFLNYYDLERASVKLGRAEEAVGCLQELFNPNDIRQMYFIRGILEHYKGNKDSSTQAFSSAIRIKPDLQWDNIYAPDAKTNFDEAKKHFLQLDSIPMEIYPTEAASSLWINGAPLLDKDQPTIFVGTNIIQIVGLETKTYELTIPDNTESVRIIAPSTTPASAIDWIGQPREAELSLITEAFLEPNSTIFAHDAGIVWQNSVGSSEWVELEVSKFTEVRLNSKQIIGQSLMWAGGTTSLISLGMGIYHYNKGYTAYQVTQSTDDWSEYETKTTILDASRAPYRSAFISLGTGLLLTGIGYTIAF